MQIVSNVSASVGAVMQAGRVRELARRAFGGLRQGRRRCAVGRRSRDEEVLAFLDKHYPDANQLDSSVIYGYGAAQTLMKVLEMCGDDLTRANMMKQAASLKDFTPDTLLPGVKINTSPTDFAPIEQLQMSASRARSGRCSATSSAAIW